MAVVAIESATLEALFDLLVLLAPAVIGVACIAFGAIAPRFQRRR